MRFNVRDPKQHTYAGTPLARISHRELIDKLYEFHTAFL